MAWKTFVSTMPLHIRLSPLLAYLTLPPYLSFMAPGLAAAGIII